jgi:hypothetical protein
VDLGQVQQWITKVEARSFRSFTRPQTAQLHRLEKASTFKINTEYSQMIRNSLQERQRRYFDVLSRNFTQTRLEAKECPGPFTANASRASQRGPSSLLQSRNVVHRRSSCAVSPRGAFGACASKRRSTAWLCTEGTGSSRRNTQSLGCPLSGRATHDNPVATTPRSVHKGQVTIVDKRRWTTVQIFRRNLPNQQLRYNHDITRYNVI